MLLPTDWPSSGGVAQQTGNVNEKTDERREAQSPQSLLTQAGLLSGSLRQDFVHLSCVVAAHKPSYMVVFISSGSLGCVCVPG